MKQTNQLGIGLIEILLSILMFSIISLIVTSNMMTSFKTHKKVLVRQAMNNLATEQLERYASVNPYYLDNSDDDSETGLTVPFLESITFARTTDVSINADNSRTVEVTVTPEHADFSSLSKTLDTTFIRW